MKTLITGHRGFIGSQLLKALPEAVTIDLKDGQDLLDCDFPEECDLIFHLAAQASIPASFEKPINSHMNNVAATLRVLEYARQTKAKVVFSSSSSIYGEAELPTREDQPKKPVSPYALNKLECELYCAFYWQLGVKSVALRYFNVFGEDQEISNGGYALVLPIFLKQYRMNEPFTIVGTGEQRRDFIYVKDVVEANLKAAQWLETADHFEAFNIGSGKNYSINQVAQFISPDQPQVFLPPRPEPFANLADISKAKEILKWSPTLTLEQWLKR